MQNCKEIPLFITNFIYKTVVWLILNNWQNHENDRMNMLTKKEFSATLFSVFKYGQHFTGKNDICPDMFYMLCVADI